MTAAKGKPRPGINGDPTTPRVGVAGWVVSVLDGLLSAGIVSAEELEDFSARELTELARLAVKSAYGHFDVTGALGPLKG